MTHVESQTNEAIDLADQASQANPTFDPSRAFAPVPADQPEQQRAICMVKGKLIIVDAKKNEGILKVKNTHFPCTFTGRLKPLFMVKQVNKDLYFNAWPKAQTDKQPAQLLLQLHSFRKDIAKEFNGLCEIRGKIQAINPTDFIVSIYSQKTQETFTIPVQGDCPGQIGELYKIEGFLTLNSLTMVNSQAIESSHARSK